MLHEEFAPASRPRTESLFPFAPPPRLRRPQSVSQSLFPVSRASPFIPRSLLRPRSRSHIPPSPPLPPRPSSCPCRFPSLSTISIPLLLPSPPILIPLSLSLGFSPLSRTLLFPPPRNFFLFYAALYRCTCLLTRSPLRFFHRSLPSVLSSTRRASSPPSFRPFSSVPRISLYPASILYPPRSRLVYPSSIPQRDRAHHLRHISNLTRILSAAVSQTLKSFLGN